MELVAQLFLGVSLAACCGIRAFLPLFVMGLLSRAHYAEINPAFSFMMRDDALVIFGLATALEVLGDKFIAVDHFLDAVGAVVRPVLGTVVAAAVLTKLDPVAATVLGLILGGTTAFTMNAGKAIARYKVSAFSPAHAGLGNFSVSLFEDAAVGIGLWIAAHAPIVAFVLTLISIGIAVWLTVHSVKWLKSVKSRLRSRHTQAPSSSP